MLGHEHSFPRRSGTVQVDRNRAAVAYVRQAMADDLKSMPVGRAEQLVVSFARLVAVHPKGIAVVPTSLLPASKEELKQAFCLIYRLLLRRNDIEHLTLMRYVFPQLARYQPFITEGPLYPEAQQPAFASDAGEPSREHRLPTEDQLVAALKSVPMPNHRELNRWMNIAAAETKLLRTQLDDVHDEEANRLRAAARQSPSRPRSAVTGWVR